MSHVIGRGRYARETFPQSPGAGGGAIAGKPLTRQRWIDGNTTSPGNGSEGAPYKTPQTFLSDTSLFPVPAANADDANTQIVGLVTPAAIDVWGTETWTVPAYRNVTLRALELMTEGESQGAIFELPTINWVNTLAAAGNPSFAAGISATSFTLDSLFLIEPTFTITDDNTKGSILQILGQAAGTLSALAGMEGGSIDATGATLFELLYGTGSLIDEVLVSTPSAIWLFDDSFVDIEGKGAAPHCAAVAAIDSSGAFLGVTAVGQVVLLRFLDQGSSLTSTTGSIMVIGTTFGNSTTTLTATAAGQAIVFDGPSFLSFTERGCTATGIVLVVGGFLGAPVIGEAISNQAAVTVALDGSGASPGFTGGGNYYEVTGPVPVGGLIVTLNPGSAEPGDVIRIASKDTSGHTIQVFDSGTAANIIAAGVGMTAPGHIDARWNGTNWVYFAAGQL